MIGVSVCLLIRRTEYITTLNIRLEFIDSSSILVIYSSDFSIHFNYFGKRPLRLGEDLQISDHPL